MEILAMQEHHNFHEEPFRYKDTQGAVLVTHNLGKMDKEPQFDELFQHSFLSKEIISQYQSIWKKSYSSAFLGKPSNNGDQRTFSDKH